MTSAMHSSSHNKVSYEKKEHEGGGRGKYRQTATETPPQQRNLPWLQHPFERGPRRLGRPDFSKARPTKQDDSEDKTSDFEGK